MYTISNPLLPSETHSSPRPSLSQRIAYQWNGSRLRQVISSSKRVVPSTLDHAKPSSIHLTKGSKASLRRDITNDHHGPDVYYDGPIDTLDQFSHDRLDWLFQPSPVEDQLSQWKDPRSIVLRKPHRTKPSSPSKTPSLTMAMLYLRVLDVVKPSSAKACSFYCQVQIQDQVYTGKPTSCVKYEKQSSQADIDEVYLLPESDRKGNVSTVHEKPVIAIEKYKEKNLGHLLGTIYSDDIYQVMMIHGTFMTERAQSLISNQELHADYLTIYLRGGTIPRWQRYWGVLHATYLVLYDFEYKKSKPAKQVIPFHTLEHVFHPSQTEEEEQMIDVGRLGLALQFASPGIENRLFFLPDSDPSGQQWEESLEYCASLSEEFRCSKSSTHESIPTKFLW